MAEDRLEAVREVIRSFGMGEHWHAAVDADMPPELARFTAELIEAYRREDLDWLLEHCHPDIEIVQMKELPDTHSYHGRDGFIEALLDWPRQWNEFTIRPVRIFAPEDGQFALQAVHSGRSRTVDIYVEAEIFFLFRVERDRLTHWDMFLTEDEALRRAAERRAHRDDDHAAERDGGEGAQEAGAEELRPDHR